MNKLMNFAASFLLISLVLLSCKKEEKTPVSNDEYYVKYSIKGNGTYSYFNVFSVHSDQGVKSFSGYQYRSWTQTYGPVKKGFNASMTVSSSNVTAEIYVSKNNGPFALKASKSGGGVSNSHVSLSCVIDF